MRLPRQYTRTIQVGVTLMAAILLMATALRPQPVPPVGPVWEFTTITSSSSGNGNGTRVTICYASPNGCRNDQSSDGQEPVMSAAARLGEKGWELTAASEGSGNSSGNGRNDRVLYFKRLRSVLNRGDSQNSR